MNDKQTNQLTMFEEVNDTLDANADIVKKVKTAQDGHAFLKTQIVGIHTQHEIQQKITTGITDDKEQTRSEYEESILKVGGGLMAHAAATDNKELYAIQIFPATNLSVCAKKSCMTMAKPYTTWHCRYNLNWQN